MNNSPSVGQAAPRPLPQPFQQLPNPEINIPALNVKVRPIELLAGLVAPSLEQSGGLALTGATLCLASATIAPASVATPCALAGAAMCLHGMTRFTLLQLSQFDVEPSHDNHLHNAERTREQELRQGSLEIARVYVDG